ncbi:MAG: hypothetical protein JOZ81_28130, partial [Chloroflexi bacterium]|nr:hypothetical protein [Chloroflexota bacterium]
MTLLELNLIGVPEVVLDGQKVTLARRGSIALLAYLALSRRAHPREFLAALLAGDSSEEQARKYLSNILVDLHQHLSRYVVATRQTVAFEWRLPHCVDVDEFETRVRDALYGETLTDLESATRLYRGEFLAGIELTDAPDFDLWLNAERERVHDQYIQALRAEVDISLKWGAWRSGIDSARRLIAEEPWLEEAHRQLMLVLARSGQRQAAVAAYRTCRRVLREELGIEPMPETTALFHRLRAAVTPPYHNLPVARSPIIGRARELRLLFELLTDPDCRLVTLTGMGGSGKTRLGLEIARSFAMPSSTLAEQPFAGGIIFVDLAESTCSKTEAADHAILFACAKALGLPTLATSTNALCQQVSTYLQPKALLLVLDSFELLQSGAQAVHLLLKHAPHLKILITARAPLHVEGERVLVIDGLGLPASPADLESAEASALFLQEARRVQVGYTLAEEQQPYLVQMCAQLGGLPLALLLAARWAPVMPCSEMVRELTNGVDVLATPEADLP